MELTLKEFLGSINDYISKEKKVFVVGVAGGSGGGKGFIAEKVSKSLGGVILCMDDYILPEKVKISDNWDLPEIWNLKLLKRHLIELKKGETIEKPVYDFSKHYICGYEKFLPAKIIILEGLYALHKIFDGLIDLKIFVYADEKLRLERRIKRDVAERGRTREKVLRKWDETVQPTYAKFVEPQKETADLIILNL